jgi:lysozyme
MAGTITALVPTVGKSQDVQSRYLPSNEVFTFLKNSLVRYNWVESHGAHYLAELQEPIRGRFNWFFFKSHVKVQGEHTLTVSQSALELLILREGFSSKAYWDDLGGVWTVGYGTTYGVTEHTVFSKEKALEEKQKDLARFKEAVLSHNLQLNDNQADALTLLAYNIGSNALSGSRLMRYLASTVPTRWSVSQVEELFGRWNKAGNPLRPIAGLSRRRMQEAALFSSRDWRVWEGPDWKDQLTRAYGGSRELAGLG